MRKYTSPAQKIEMYSKKYNLPREEVNWILKEDECMLSIEQLKIKYDNQDMGILPDWLHEEYEQRFTAMEEVIDSAIIVNYYKPDFKFYTWITLEELHSYFIEWCYKNIHRIKNKTMLKASIINRMITLAREHWAKFCSDRHRPLYLDSNITKKQGEQGSTLRDLIPSHNTDFQDAEVVSSIRSVKNKTVKTLLIVVGYLMCDIVALRKDYLDVLRSNDKQVYKSLNRIERTISSNDKLKAKRKLGEQVSERIKTIRIQDIIEALNLTKQNSTEHKPVVEQYKPREILEFTRQYIKALDIL